MNNLFFSEKHYNLREDVRKLLRKELEPTKNQINKNNKIPIVLIKKLGKNGLIGPLIPEKYSGY
jgi:alkylation response protein AidB-like acyl-CoA dehydrogenase